MKKILSSYILTCLILFTCLSAGPARAQGTEVQDRYRPWVRWWWNGDKVDTLELKRELQVLRKAGIGGVEINPIEFPAKRCDSLGIASLTWLSDEWLDALACTLREAGRMGLGCDMLVGSGWPFGMESLPMEERAQVMLTLALPLHGDTLLTRQQIFDAVDPQVTVPNPDRQFELVALLLTPDTLASLGQVVTLPLTPADTLRIADHRGFLYALVRCRSFASVINGAPGASGPILDHMNRAAVEHFLGYMQGRLEQRLGPMRKWLRAYFVDSMELEGSNWTTDMAEEFRRRRGYDLMPWLPFTMFKTGRLGNVESYQYGACQTPEFRAQVRQVRHDFELTKAELLDERYTQTFLSWCRRQGVKSRAQAYGRGFFPLESSLGYDIPEGESWTTNYLRHRVGYEMGDHDYRRGRAYTMINKYVSSAAHLTGKRLVSAEEMTNTYMLFNTPLELLKVGSDMSAFSGTTHSVWHGFNYNPPAAGFPGWVQYGSYLNEQNSWWPYFHLLNEYRARMSEVLQHAELQADIAIELPIDDLWAEYGVQTEPFPNYPRGSIYEIPQLLWEAIHKNGGNCDFVTPRTQGMKRYQAQFSFTDSCIVLQYRGDTHRLSLPDSNRYLEWYAGVQRQYDLPHAVTIERPDRFLLQNHYRTDAGQDLYLFVNADMSDHNLGHGGFFTFPQEVTRRRQAWRYDCSTGLREPLYPEEDGRYHLSFGVSESYFVIFDKPRLQKPRQGRTIGDRYPLPPLRHWTLALHHAIEQWDTVVVLDTLQDLRNTPFADFSGVLEYSTVVSLDSSAESSGAHTLRCETHDICELTINGISCGVIWFGERSFHIPTGVMHPGENTIRLKLTTTLNNYAHTLTDDKVVQHFVLKRNIPTSPAGLLEPVMLW